MQEQPKATKGLGLFSGNYVMRHGSLLLLIPRAGYEALYSTRARLCIKIGTSIYITALLYV